MSTVDRNDLIEDLEAGCKPPGDWRIGVEHEMFLFRRADRQPAPYHGPGGTRALLERFESPDRPAKREGEALFGLGGPDGSGYGLEPGGQFERATAPLPDVASVEAALGAHLDATARAAGELGLGLLGLAFPPEWGLEAMPRTPMSRFAIMRRYMPRVGNHGLDMMHRTASTQVNLDFASESDMVTKLRVALAFQPIAAALVANSPFADGAPGGHLSHRGRVWLDVDAERTGAPDFVFEEGMGFERWVDYALDTPMYSVSRAGRHVDLAGRSFRDLLEGRLAELPGERPTRDDWRAHLNTLMPDARLKRYLELRGADTGSAAGVAALAAFWAGLLYDPAALAAAWSMARDWTDEERAGMRREAPTRGLAMPFRGQRLQRFAVEAVEIAREGLGRRRAAPAGMPGGDERDRLEALAEVAATNRPPAIRWLEAYEGPWRGDLSHAYEAGLPAASRDRRDRADRGP